MRNYKDEFEKRVAFIRDLVSNANANGIVFGNSGGKDSALVGILCKAACENTVGIIMPCSSSRNYDMDARDGREVADKFGIETRVVDITPVKKAMIGELSDVTDVNKIAKINIAPRLRMTTLYAIAASEGRLVAGTGNRSEVFIGYFTKWGDGAHDFNPISDLTVTEIYEFLRYLEAPSCVIEKAPSAGLFDSQTDEGEMGFTYAELDSFLLNGEATAETMEKIQKMHNKSNHKREGIKRFSE